MRISTGLPWFGALRELTSRKNSPRASFTTEAVRPAAEDPFPDV